MIVFARWAAWLTFVTWTAITAGSGFRNYYGFGDPAEGCHWRAEERYRYFQFVPLKRTTVVLCWHYASELLK